MKSATYPSLKLILFYFLVIYGLLACENGAYIEKDDALRIITDWESGHVPDAITHSLFNEVRIHLEYLIGMEEGNSVVRKPVTHKISFL